MASILNVDQINNAAGTSAVTIDPSTGKPSFPNGMTLPAGVGGKVLQVVQSSSDSTFTTTSASNTIVVSTTITPSSTSNKILLLATARIGATRSGDQLIAMWGVGETLSGGSRSELITNAANTGQGIHLRYINSPAAAAMFAGVSYQRLRTPSTTSAITYDIANIKQSSMANNYVIQPTLTLMEIAG